MAYQRRNSGWEGLGRFAAKLAMIFFVSVLLLAMTFAWFAAMGGVSGWTRTPGYPRGVTLPLIAILLIEAIGAAASGLALVAMGLYATVKLVVEQFRK